MQKPLEHQTQNLRQKLAALQHKLQQMQETLTELANSAQQIESEIRQPNPIPGTLSSVYANSGDLKQAQYQITPEEEAIKAVEEIVEDDQDWLYCEENEEVMIITTGTDILVADNEINWWHKQGRLNLSKPELIKSWKKDIESGETVMGLTDWVQTYHLLPSND